jgi:hypothetical protein
VSRLSAGILLILALSSLVPHKAVLAATEFVAAPTWRPAAPAEVRTEVFAWIDSQSFDAAQKAKAHALWPGDLQLAAADVLDRTMQTIAQVHEPTRLLVEHCSRLAGEAVPDTEWLEDENLDPLVRNNARLLYGRWLVQQRLFDESAVALSALQPSEVVDPAALLFYQSVGHHAMLDRESGLRSLSRLLERRNEVPSRFASLATLMLEDLKALEDDSLDHISRRMADIKRRLELGRAGDKTIEVENGVIASLDKLIKDMEEQQQQQQQASASGQTVPGQPARDSLPLGGKGRGEVVKRDVGSKSGWGDLPPRERQEAIQGMSKNLPSHYRDVIESYFKRLAGENNEP